jgi:O-antigen/teichoic acid export membrane protein
MRLFSGIVAVATTFLMPLWPAYGEAVARNDVAWVRRTLRRSLALAVAVTAPPSALLVAFGAPIVRLWVGPGIAPSRALLSAMAVWAVLTTVGGAAAIFLNGANRVKFQVVCAVFMAAGSIALKVALARRMDVAGIVWGTVIAYFACTALPMLWYVPRLLRELESRNPAPLTGCGT